jgi:hypothetical protein
LPRVAFHGKGKRGIRIGGRLGLMDAEVGGHCCAAAITGRLPWYPHARHAKGSWRGGFKDTPEDRQSAGAGVGEIIQALPSLRI